MEVSLPEALAQGNLLGPGGYATFQDRVVLEPGEHVLGLFDGGPPLVYRHRYRRHLVVQRTRDVLHVLKRLLELAKADVDAVVQDVLVVQEGS